MNELIVIVAWIFAISIVGFAVQLVSHAVINWQGEVTHYDKKTLKVKILDTETPQSRDEVTVATAEEAQSLPKRNPKPRTVAHKKKSKALEASKEISIPQFTLKPIKLDFSSPLKFNTELEIDGLKAAEYEIDFMSKQFGVSPDAVRRAISKVTKSGQMAVNYEALENVLQSKKNPRPRARGSRKKQDK